MASRSNPRPLDHLVLQVSGLGVARQRLTALGFTVAPDGVHPFGTANCCVFFADGTFLEPLDFVDRSKAEREASAGNVFTSHALENRGRNGSEGFSALVFGTDDAARDHLQFLEQGHSAGDILNFGRDFVAADGTRDKAEFRLAFAQADQAADCLFFVAERVAVPNVDRSALLRHENGVSGIARAIMTAPEPAALAAFLETVSAAPVETGPEGTVLRSGAFALEVVTPEAFAKRTGLPAPDSGKPQFSAVAFSCAATKQVSEHLLLSGIDFSWTPAGLVVPPEPGQGTTLVFQLPEND